MSRVPSFASSNPSYFPAPVVRERTLRKISWAAKYASYQRVRGLVKMLHKTKIVKSFERVILGRAPKCYVAEFERLMGSEGRKKKGAPKMKVFLEMCMKIKGRKKWRRVFLEMLMKTNSLRCSSGEVIESK